MTNDQIQDMNQFEGSIFGCQGSFILKKQGIQVDHTSTFPDKEGKVG